MRFLQRETNLVPRFARANTQQNNGQVNAQFLSSFRELISRKLLFALKKVTYIKYTL